MTFRYHSARYEMRVENPRGVSRGVISTEVDGQMLVERGGRPSLRQAEVSLVDDGATHEIVIILG